MGDGRPDRMSVTDRGWLVWAWTAWRAHGWLAPPHGSLAWAACLAPTPRLAAACKVPTPWLAGKDPVPVADPKAAGVDPIAGRAPTALAAWRRPHEWLGAVSLLVPPLGHHKNGGDQRPRAGLGPVPSSLPGDRDSSPTSPRASNPLSLPEAVTSAYAGLPGKDIG